MDSPELMTSPVLSLNQCWISWIAVARECQKREIPCAAPFFSAKPDEYDASVRRILLVGKATDRWDWYCDEGLDSGLSDVELAANQVTQNGWFRDARKNDRSRHPGFWKFLLRLSEEVGVGGKNPHDLIWTNLYKLGNQLGKPGVKLRNIQEALAIETLRAEIGEYRPTLVVFVTSGYKEDVVKAAVGDDLEWQAEAKGTDGESWSLRLPDGPAMLWVRHPSRKSGATLNEWLRRAKALNLLT